MMKKKKVVIIQRTIKFYQLKFFELLKSICAENNIELVLLYGKDEKLSFNDAEISWGIKLHNYKIDILGKTLYYQPVFKHIKDADLIIVEQATKFIINYYLWLLNLIGLKRLAFWGHGINFQNDNPNSVSEFVKKLMTKRVHWFFAYNDLSKRVLENIGLPSKKITVINNTIDVESIKNEIKKYNNNNIAAIKNELGIRSKNICIYVGGIYKEKSTPFLIESLIIVRNIVTDLEVIFIGDGPDKKSIIDSAKKNVWMHYLGPKNEKEKIPYFLMAKLLTVPASVGLVIIDSFVFGVPLVTSNSNDHGPEIDYLQNDINGVMTSNDVIKYADTIIRLLRNEEERQKLVEGCKVSAEKYTMKNMVEKFYDGIAKSLNINK